MKKETLNTENLQIAARVFCEAESGKFRKELFGITDGKAVGTFVEHLFQDFLNNRFTMEVGSSAMALTCHQSIQT